MHEVSCQAGKFSHLLDAAHKQLKSRWNEFEWILLEMQSFSKQCSC